MDLRKRGPEYHPLELHEDTIEPEGIELTVLSKSWTPSYIPLAKQSQYSEDDDRAALIYRSPSQSGFKVMAKQAVPWIQGKRQELQGWRFGVSRSAWLATAVLILNTLLTVAAVAKFGSEDGIGTAYTGSCSRTNSITTSLHVLINVLSSVLLGASNYTMQALVAPTRGDLDSAHSKGDWMDVGVASTRNLLKISWHRTLLWLILALSSVPIHLLYNSAVFKNIDANAYVAIVANPDWLKGGNFSTNVQWVDYNYTALYAGNDALLEIQKIFHENLHATSLISNLTTSQCISTYGTTFVSGRSNVVAITNERGKSSIETVFFSMDNYGETEDPEWLCAQNNSVAYKTKCQLQRLKETQDWRINGRRIEYCLSQLQPQHCSVQFSAYILIAVICMNALKSMVMFVTVYGQRESTIVTVGDAIASYLHKPDNYTQKRCLIDRGDMAMWRTHGASKPLSRVHQDDKGSRWFSAVRKTKWATCILSISATIIASGFLIGMGASSIKFNDGSPWSLAWGAIDTNAMFQGSYSLPQDGARGLIVSVLLANCPQALVSFLYLLYNSLLTSLLLAKEWTTYASERKALRVTTRSGLYQRSTYYLHLPFRYSIPLLSISAILHWVISQSIFLARVAYYEDGEKDSESSNVSNIGFSLPPILTAMIIGFLMLTLLIGLGFRKLGNMPVAGSCSVAISAACHRPEEDVDAALLPVQWGAVEGMKDGVGHACFTSQAVSPLVPGRLYA